MRAILILLLAPLSFIQEANGQSITSVAEQKCADSEGPVHVSPLHSDSACSSFLICIDTEVKPHLHRMHTEHVFVLDGEGLMRLGDSERAVKAGDAIVIPPGTPHSVRVTGTAPLRVISVQSPHFDGSDRVMLEVR